ncbi:type VI secretion protein [Achromobacter sp. KAs 3-5]|nr:type VI secretion protein [Achromobacter sp. KAs 3-5]
MKGFEPSLFDKLFEAEGQSPYALRRLSIEEMKETVARDIEALLNTRMVFTEEDLRRFPNCQRSVLTYGLSDFSGLSLASHYDREFICRSLEQAIARHEPRLTHVRVDAPGGQPRDAVLYFAITAMLDVGARRGTFRSTASLTPSPPLPPALARLPVPVVLDHFRDDSGSAAAGRSARAAGAGAGR